VAALGWVAGADGPGAWRDEVATVALSGRSTGEILALAGHVDAVLAAYYLLVHAVAPGDLAGARLLSVAASAVAAALLMPLARRLGAPAAGGWAAAFVVVSPVAARWAQEARPAALASLAAVAATLALVSAVRDGSRRWWAAYAAALVALGYLQLSALLLVPAHAVTVLVAGRGRLRPWAAATLAALLAIAPLVRLGLGQRAAIAWIDRPTVARLQGLPEFLAGSGTVVSVLALVAGAALARHRAAPGGGVGVLPVALPWLLIPPVALWAAGQVTPLFTERYLVFCLPAAALLAGRALAGVRGPHAVAAVVAVAVAGLPEQVGVRAAGGHAEDTTRVLAVLDAGGRPGDALVLTQADTRLLAEAYPEPFAHLDDVTAGTSGAEAGTFGGTPPAAFDQTVRARMRHHTRVWVVALAGTAPDPPAAAALDAVPDLSPVRSWQVPPYTLTLYAIPSAATATAGLETPTALRAPTDR
jgi:mannosyltransferase